MKNRIHLIFTLMLIIGDALAILTAYSLAFIIRVKVSDIPTHELVAARDYFLSLLVLLPFIILMFSLVGTYTSRPHSRWAQVGRVLFGSLGAMLFMIAIDYFHNVPIFPAKLVPLYGFLFSILFLSLERGILYSARYLRRRNNIGITLVVIVGLSDAARDLIAAIKNDRNYQIQAVVGDGRGATHKTWRGAMRNFNPQIIIQVATAKKPDIDLELLDFAKANYIDFKFVPRETSQTSDRVELELFMDNVPVMALRPTALDGWGRIIKRVFDFLVALIALVILSPIFLVIAIINKIIFGKVFFHHMRLTRGDQKFQFYKFQTVRKDLNGLTPEEAFTKIGRPSLIKKYRANGDFLPDDPRYGAWARFLRKTSLDELPQFWNVLRGDISLVGPRALIPEELADYEKKHAILNVKSGLTGLAQISGRRNLSWDKRRQLDVYYVQNWSFALDIQILAKTFLQILIGRGAK